MVDLDEIKLNKEITEAIDKKEFLLFPQAPAQTKDERPGLVGTQKIRSAMIAPIMDPAGCFGVLYIDNAEDQESYNLSDLDYAVLLAIHTAAIVENF
ncbi:MAG: GAF domain-containing protein [Planctomycetota bacterium]|jgi:GAF domain-containing protein